MPNSSLTEDYHSHSNEREKGARHLFGQPESLGNIGGNKREL